MTYGTCCMRTMNPLDPTTLKAGSVTMRGFSRSGVATWLEVPEFSAVFDLGVCPLSSLSLEHVFITHGHPDHAASLLRHAGLRAMMAQPTPAKVYLPAALVSKFHTLISAQAAIEEETVEQHAKPDFVGLKAGQRAELPHRPHIWVEAFPVEHVVESLGYTLLEKRKKLKPEYAELAGSEIGALRNQGVLVQEEVFKPVFTFLGDHTGRTLIEQEHIWNSPVLVLETTFLEPDERSRAREYGHTHIAELVEALERFGDHSKVQHLVLKHFSMKYSHETIRAVVAQVIPERFLPRIQLLLG